MSQFLEYFGSCTAAILRDSQIRGTAFFASPDFLVTCAHVVEGLGDRVEVSCGGIKATGSLFAKGNPRSLLESRPGDSLHPDLAIIRFPSDSFPADKKISCVLLEEETPRLDEPLYTYGHAAGEYAQNGEALLLNYEGPAQDLLGRNMLKLRQGNVRAGMSGAPLLNRRTGSVCGTLFASRDVNSALGGRGIPVPYLFSLAPDLKPAHDSFHRANTKWSDLWGAREGAVRLMEFPRGPVVPQDRVGVALIRAVAAVYPTPLKAPAIIMQANRLRQQADGDAGTIDFASIPPPTTASFDYWFHTFLEACLQGPRMLAALLLVMDEWQFPEPAKIERQQILEDLRLP